MEILEFIFDYTDRSICSDMLGGNRYKSVFFRRCVQSAIRTGQESSLRFPESQDLKKKVVYET
jgi:hypothetical protein